MKKITLISVIFTLILFSFSAIASAGVEIKSKDFFYQSSDKKFSIAIKYPQVIGLENPTVEKELNEFFKKEFFSGYEDLYGREVNFLDDKDLQFCYDDFISNFPESTYSIELEYDTGANKNGIFSVRSAGLAMLTPSAHPTKLVNTFTVNLNTGQIYEFKDLFKENSDYMTLLEDLIKKYEYYIDKNGEVYDFYLTPEELVLININTPHIIQGFEGNIKFQEIKDILSPGGPINILMEK